ncbi:hypothetical protein PIROE2DRAFT_10824 [Piromyces sp. E2]|nr:hypothetical protein PIROE2DRAFT_10824 [Piromyces sp. E2]|eukprot:OUM62790.1 hypothetical protein PIROE2DRAFT_10824 [Piromyces sp. E2]
MKIRNIDVLLVVNLIKVSGTLYTLQGNEIPDSLKFYLNCPIGDFLCKNEKKSQCLLKHNICKESSSDTLSENLIYNGYIIDNILPDLFCHIFQEVCDMILDYNPPLTNDNIYEYDRYFICNTKDITCIQNQKSSCQTVLTQCWDLYPKIDCEHLSIVCENIENGIKPLFNSLKIKTPLGKDIPHSLVTYLSCPRNDIKCKKKKKILCKKSSSICQKNNHKNLGQKLRENDHIINNLSPEIDCQIFVEVCDMIMKYEPPFTDNYIYNLNHYLSCNADNTICQYEQDGSYRTVLDRYFQNMSIKFYQFPVVKYFRKMKLQLMKRTSRYFNQSSFSSQKIRKKQNKRKIMKKSSKKKSKQKKPSIEKKFYQQQHQRNHPFKNIQQRSKKQINKYLRNNYIQVDEIIEKIIIKHIPERIQNLLPKKLPIKRTSLRKIHLLKRILRNVF